MWLNKEKISEPAIAHYQASLLCSCPNHIVIDGLFNAAKLDQVLNVLQQPQDWKTQQHTYSALYVGNVEWQQASQEERFVQRDAWQRSLVRSNTRRSIIADDFLSFLRSDEFLSLLSHIFKVTLTDINVADPDINTNYFRLAADDFVEQHADDSPGRKVCMLLYLNKNWQHNAGGDLIFMAKDKQPLSIAPLYNRCVLFDPFSKGSEHWVKKLNPNDTGIYRYNVTSWYWTE